MTWRFEVVSIGEIAAADARAARLFERLGIDFCCGGRRSVDEACRRANVDPALVIRELASLAPDASDSDEVSHWPLGRLIDHIVSRHHAYVHRALPVIAAHLARLEDAHGQRHPELAHVRRMFTRLSEDLLWHLRKEEHVLFPYVRELAGAHPREAVLPNPFGTIRNPIRMMEREHQQVADLLREIRELTHGFGTPPDIGVDYAVCMEEFAEFERDLHRHVHLENNILFPKAIALEPAGVEPEIA